MLRLLVGCRSTSLAAAVALALSPRLAQAEPAGPQSIPGARTHDSLYLHGEFALGRTWLNYHAPMNTGVNHRGRATGGALGGQLALGWTLPFGLVLGGVVLGQSQGNMEFSNPDVVRGWDGSSTSLSGGGAFGRWYPLSSAGFHVEALASAVRHRTRHRVYVITNVPWTCPIVLPTCADIEGKEVIAVETSLGYLLGVGAGYGFWFANQWSFELTGRMQFAQTRRRERRYSFYMPTLGVGVTYH
jgi:hypothetical protein